jgi:ubiquinone/menaquinone biosynthesis C-methylase UbiE
MFRIQGYLADLYKNTMSRVYQEAHQRIIKSLMPGGYCLDCGAGKGGQIQNLSKMANISEKNYIGIEWSPRSLAVAKSKGLQVLQGDLNQSLPFVEQSFQCVFGLSVLEHLVNGCLFLQEAYRVLKPGGHLILVTPNLSAWFNVFLLGIGKMPSSGPHPDAAELVQKNMPLKFQKKGVAQRVENMSTNRHLVVFTYRVLKDYLNFIGFKHINSKAFGYYPFPKSLQGLFERLDPWHCHQMVFDCQR